MDIGNAILSLNNLLPGFLQQDYSDKQEKIELLYSYGFIFMPYEKELYNPFTQTSFKLQILNSSVENLTQFLMDKTPKPLTGEILESKIDDLYTKIDKGRSLRLFLGVYSVIIAVFLAAISIALYFVSQTLQVPYLVGLAISCCLIHYWVSFQTLIARYESLYLYSPVFQKSPSLWQVVRLVIMITTIYLTYRAFETVLFWSFIGGLVFLILMTNLLITSNVKGQWWGHQGLIVLRQYYKPADM